MFTLQNKHLKPTHNFPALPTKPFNRKAKNAPSNSNKFFHYNNKQKIVYHSIFFARKNVESCAVLDTGNGDVIVNTTTLEKPR